MNWVILFCYLGLVIVLWTPLYKAIGGILGLPVAIIESLFPRDEPRRLLYLARGSIMWLGLSILWVLAVGYWMPLLAFIIGFASISIQGVYSGLTKREMEKVVDEMWGLTMIALVVMIFVEFNWY